VNPATKHGCTFPGMEQSRELMAATASKLSEEMIQLQDIVYNTRSSVRIARSDMRQRVVGWVKAKSDSANAGFYSLSSWKPTVSKTKTW